MDTVESICEECEETVPSVGAGVHTGARNIAEVLAMSVTEAEKFFDDGEGMHRPPTRSSSGSPTSGSATSTSASR